MRSHQEPRLLPRFSIETTPLLVCDAETCRRGLSAIRHIEVFTADSNRDISTAFASIVQKRIDALVVSPDP